MAQPNATCAVCSETSYYVRFPGPLRAHTHDSSCQICRPCWRAHIASQLESTFVDQISCPTQACSRVLTADEVHQILGSGQTDDYDNRLLRHTLAALPEYESCTRATCHSGQIHQSSSEQPIFTCQACGHKHCVLCKRDWHAGVTCAAHLRQTRATPGETASSGLSMDEERNAPIESLPAQQQCKTSHSTSSPPLLAAEWYERPTALDAGSVRPPLQDASTTGTSVSQAGFNQSPSAGNGAGSSSSHHGSFPRPAATPAPVTEPPRSPACEDDTRSDSPDNTMGEHLHAAVEDVEADDTDTDSEYDWGIPPDIRVVDDRDDEAEGEDGEVSRTRINTRSSIRPRTPPLLLPPKPASPEAPDPNAQWYLPEGTKACPGCGIRIAKYDGCDHMTCSKCRHEFCWECLAEYDRIRMEGNHRHNLGCSYFVYYAGGVVHEESRVLRALRPAQVQAQVQRHPRETEQRATARTQLPSHGSTRTPPTGQRNQPLLIDIIDIDDDD